MDFENFEKLLDEYARRVRKTRDAEIDAGNCQTAFDRHRARVADAAEDEAREALLAFVRTEAP